MDLANINKPFVWRKKFEEKGIKVDEKEIEAEARRKAEENQIELQKLRERQCKRDLEYQQKLNDGEFLQRQKEAERHELWEQQEDDFVLRQHCKRSKIRIRDGRAKPIDLLAHYIDIFGVKQDDKRNDTAYLQDEKIDLSDSPVELLNPCDWFNGLRQADLEALEPDINIYMNADCEQNQQYWKDLLEITRNELSKLRASKEQADLGNSGSGEINAALTTDIMSLFDGKTIQELDDLELEMSGILKSDDPSIDIAFYQNVISRLRAHRAKTRLTINHKKNLKRQKDKILEVPKSDDQKPLHSINPTGETSNLDNIDGQENFDKAGLKEDEKQGDVEMECQSDVEPASEDETKQIDKFEAAQGKCIEEYKEGRYSPRMLSKDDLDPGTICVEFEKEYAILVHQRNQVCNATNLDEAKLVTMTSEERAFMDAARKGMNNQEESTFSCEENVRGPGNRIQTYAWADKYQPRKPRYFNRVHTGFEWNKYNQTHYDIDNPPPKVVQGYKFNIFYPDLIDKSKAPTFSLTPCKEDKDFCTIRFSAGPPYEDIAFRIVNREWNNSHKSGYRCQFINNMLQLWFQFKRYRYRR